MPPSGLCWLKAWAVAPSQITLISGETSRQKRFLVIGVTPDDLRRRLAAVLPDAGPTLPLS